MNDSTENRSDEHDGNVVSRPIARRTALKSAAAVLGASAFGLNFSPVSAAPQRLIQRDAFPVHHGQVGFVLSHEQFAVPDLLSLGYAAEAAGFDTVWTSDHFQPWMANQGHEGMAWVTLAALGQRTQRIAFGTGVTCPTFRYDPAIVAQGFATLGQLYPGRVFLGVGTGEALNEQTGTGRWAPWQERSDRLVEAVQLIRELWSGNTTNHQGQYYTVESARLYDLPSTPVPIFMAANGPKSAARAGQYGDGWITDVKSLLDPQMRAQFEAGAALSGKDAAQIPILVESFVVVGGQREAEEAAAYWRFIPKSWKPYVNVHDPERILHRAEVEIPLEDVYKDWPISTDPDVHVQALVKLFDAGATQVYVHSGQLDQARVIEFYGQYVLPRLRRQM